MTLTQLRTMGALLVVVAIGATAISNQPDGAELGIDPKALPTSVDGFDNVKGGVYKDGRLFIAGQPDREAFRQFKELGVTLVVNLRTPGEMNDRERVPFDEAAVLEEIGLEYLHIPLGGDDHPYTPDAVSAFAQALEKHRGPVLLHCTIAWRASYLWVAYLILYHDFEFDAALERGEAVAIGPPPLQGLLGRELTLAYE